MKMDLHGDKERILIVDEIQKIDNWSEQVKKEWDSDTFHDVNLKVILLGSSRVLLQKGLNESLTGRFETIKMGFWEWAEMRDAFGYTIQQYIYFGGFPGLAQDFHNEDRWRNLMEDTIITPILTRDILEIEEIRNPALLRQVFELACIESARELSLTKMQGTMNSGTVPTIKSYLDILDQTMMAFTVLYFLARSFNCLQVFTSPLFLARARSSISSSISNIILRMESGVTIPSPSQL